MAFVDKVLTKRMRFFLGLYQQWNLLEIFLKIAYFYALFVWGNNLKLNISLKEGSSSELAYGFVCLLSKEVPCQFLEEKNDPKQLENLT